MAAKNSVQHVINCVDIFDLWTIYRDMAVKNSVRHVIFVWIRFVCE